MEHKFISRFAYENGKQKEFIEVTQTKTGNRYVTLSNEKTMKGIPYECLLCFCNQFPEEPIMTKEEMDTLRKKIDVFLDMYKKRVIFVLKKE